MHNKKSLSRELSLISLGLINDKGNFKLNKLQIEEIFESALDTLINFCRDELDNCESDLENAAQKILDSELLEGTNSSFSPVRDELKKSLKKIETFSMSIFRSLKATYYREALDFVQIFKKDALMNKFEIDVHEEESAVELFAKNIMIAGQVFLDSPMESPNIPTWSRVDTAIPNFLNDLKKTVQRDNQV